MRRTWTTALTLAILAAVLPGGRAQWPVGMGYRGPGAAGYAPGGLPGAGGAGFAPFVGVYGGYQGFNSTYGPNPASVPSAAYLSIGGTSYTTEFPSPLPVYTPTNAYPPPLPLTSFGATASALPSGPFSLTPPGTPLTALLLVQVPADAEVWLEGQRMRSTGAARRYRTPPLDPVKGYAYEVRARWPFDGKAVEEVRHVAVRAGATVIVDFTHLDPLVPRPSQPPPAPKPAPKSAEPPADAPADKPAR